MPGMYESLDSIEFRRERSMITNMNTAAWLREMIAMESEGEVTQRLPVICPEAFEVATLTQSEVRAALALEFGEAA